MTERYSSLWLIQGVSGPMERMHPSLRIAPPELGALLRRHECPRPTPGSGSVLPKRRVRPARTGSSPRGRSRSAHAAKVLFREARHELVLVVAPEYLVLRWHAGHTREGPRERALPMRLQPSERDERQ